MNSSQQALYLESDLIINMVSHALALDNNEVMGMERSKLLNAANNRVAEELLVKALKIFPHYKEEIESKLFLLDQASIMREISERMTVQEISELVETSSKSGWFWKMRHFIFNLVTLGGLSKIENKLVGKMLNMDLKTVAKSNREDVSKAIYYIALLSEDSQ